MTCQARRTPWTREQIQAARRTPLPDLLHKRGLHLRESGAGNYRLSEHAGIVIKQSYWRDPDTQRGGNTIDFFEAVLGMTFNQAMEAITR